ncbi:MAG: FMN-binding negative transcriptional regulator [Bdellovibrionota bacterium]
MYSPGHYKVSDEAIIEELVNAESFATLLTPSIPEPVTSHLPFLMDKSDSAKPKMLSHMARANPHWKAFAQNPSAMLIFQGPHAYISPAWYEPKPDNVPTWNYAVVHVHGTAKLIEDRERAFLAMQTMVNTFETKYRTGWKLDVPANAGIDALMNAIVVFEVVELRFEAKFKLSQKHSDVNRKNVIAALDYAGQSELARYMKRTFET